MALLKDTAPVLNASMPHPAGIAFGEHQIKYVPIMLMFRGTLNDSIAYDWLVFVCPTHGRPSQAITSYLSNKNNRPTLHRTINLSEQRMTFR